MFIGGLIFLANFVTFLETSIYVNLYESYVHLYEGSLCDIFTYHMVLSDTRYLLVLSQFGCCKHL